MPRLGCRPSEPASVKVMEISAPGTVGCSSGVEAARLGLRLRARAATPALTACSIFAAKLGWRSRASPAAAADGCLCVKIFGPESVAHQSQNSRKTVVKQSKKRSKIAPLQHKVHRAGDCRSQSQSRSHPNRGGTHEMHRQRPAARLDRVDDLLVRHAYD